MSRQLVLSMLSALVLALAGPARAETKLYLVETLAAEADHAPLRAQAQELEAIYADLAKPFAEQSMEIHYLPVRLDSGPDLYVEWASRQGKPT